MVHRVKLTAHLISWPLVNLATRIHLHWQLCHQTLVLHALLSRFWKMWFYDVISNILDILPRFILILPSLVRLHLRLALFKHKSFRMLSLYDRGVGVHYGRVNCDFVSPIVQYQIIPQDIIRFLDIILAVCWSCPLGGLIIIVYRLGLRYFLWWLWKWRTNLVSLALSLGILLEKWFLGADPR